MAIPRNEQVLCECMYAAELAMLTLVRKCDDTLANAKVCHHTPSLGHLELINPVTPVVILCQSGFMDAMAERSYV